MCGNSNIPKILDRKYISNSFVVSYNANIKIIVFFACNEQFKCSSYFFYMEGSEDTPMLRFCFAKHIFKRPN